MTRPVWRWIVGAFFILAGSNHFLNPESYLAIMPQRLPYPSELVWISGLAEILGGIGVLFSATRIPAGWGLIALLVAVFPANVQAALHGWPGSSMPSWVLWLRLPFQPIFIWCVYRLCIRRNNPPTTPR